VQPLAFFLFFAATTAESKRIPFDVPEGESEIVGGYFTEYSGMKFGMFMTGEFIEVIVSSALIVTIFLGGYHVPFLNAGGFTELGLMLPHGVVIALQVLMFVTKLVLMIWLQFTIRWSLPRFRYDQIMSLCWKYLLPLSLLNILITGIVILLLQQYSGD
jgi:NADH-quinone oxidoreductase subunit H